MINYIQLLHSRIFSAIDLGQTDIQKTSLTNDRLNHGLQLFLGLSGAVALLIIVIASFKMVISRGNPQSIAGARDAIIYASIGLIITMAAFGIVTFVVKGL